MGYEVKLKIEDYAKQSIDGDWYKANENDKIWWFSAIDRKGDFLFSFDKERIFNLFRDNPNALTKEQKELFDKENPFWADFFKKK